MEGTAEAAQVISTQTLSYMAIEISIAVLLPLTVLLIWKYRKKNSEFLPTFAGACVYFAFAIVAKQVLDALIVGTDTPVARLITENLWTVAVYAALLTGILEETGRFVCMKFIFGDSENRLMAVSYGIGHGGFESMFVTGYPVLKYFVLANQLNVMGMDAVMEAIGDRDPEMYLATIEGIRAIGLPQVFFTFYERLLFLVFQISLSVLMFTAVHYRKKGYLFPLCILMHSVVELIMAVGSMTVSGILLSVCVLLTAFAAYRCYSGLSEE